MIQKTKVYDKEAFILENKNISCTVIPSPGAKIVSLFDNRYSREWLVPPMRPVMEAGYESKFTDGSMGGWDEMLPTIDLCEWKGIQLPDHGEVWQVPWECSTDNDSLQTAVHCRYFPFIFSRNISLFSDDTFIFSYTLTNVGEKSYPWLWAAHPQFSVNLQTKICFPEDVKQLVNVINGDPVFGAEGNVVNFPYGNGKEELHLDHIGLSDLGACRKHYCLPGCIISKAGLTDQSSCCSLWLEWDHGVIPYCGLWVDEGAYHHKPVAAIEPSSGYYDSLKKAYDNHRLPYLDPKKSVNWNLRVNFSGM